MRPTQPPSSPPKRPLRRPPPEPPLPPEPLLGGGGVVLGDGDAGVEVYGWAYQTVRRVQCPGPSRLPEQVMITSRSEALGRKTFRFGTFFAG